jgi:hypothetical protein
MLMKYVTALTAAELQAGALTKHSKYGIPIPEQK